MWAKSEVCNACSCNHQISTGLSKSDYELSEMIYFILYHDQNSGTTCHLFSRVKMSEKEGLWGNCKNEH